MIIANLLGKAKIAIMNDGEVSAWLASDPLDGDLILNSDSRSWEYSSAGGVIDIGGPVTTWRIDDTAPTGSSYFFCPQTIGRVVLLFMLDGVPFRIMAVPAIAPNQVYHNPATGYFELQINVTPAIQFNGEWVSLIYNNDSPAV